MLNQFKTASKMQIFMWELIGMNKKKIVEMIYIYLFIKSPGFHTKHYPVLSCNFEHFFH